MKRLTGCILIFFLTACNIRTPAVTVAAASSTPREPAPSPTAGIRLPAVTGPNPSTRVGAFYYSWYGNPAVDGAWIHWTQAGALPPSVIASDYFPALGAYSSNDPAVVAQHMAWLREAGVGVIIVSWWGQGAREERPLPLILQMAERYGIQVAFHIEPYSGRTADRLVSDIKYIILKYGSSPAFFRTPSSSRYSQGSQLKPIVFVWAIQSPDSDSSPVQAEYWQKAMDAVHSLTGGCLVIANTQQTSWIKDGHFDGLYNYATLHPDQSGGFAWARGLPGESLYIPSVIPGFSAKRIEYPSETYVPRLDGDTYREQWTDALGAGVEPDMITITSFNEWHEGTMIEPIAQTKPDDTYQDFGSLPPDGYLTLTRQWINQFLAMQWPSAVRIRLQVSTTSDWTTVNIKSGGIWMRPELVSSSSNAAEAGMEAGDHLVLKQSLPDAEKGKMVEMTWDLVLSGLDPGGNLTLNIERGNIGATRVVIFNYLGSTPLEIKSFQWAGITTGRNSFPASISSADLIRPVP